MRMLKMMLFPALLVLAAMAQEVSPQGAPAAEPVPEPPRRILFSIFVWPSQGILSSDTNLVGIPRAFYDSPTGPESILLRRNISTPLLAYQGPQPLRIYDAETRLVPPPKDAPPGTLPTRELVKKTFIHVEIPENMERVMLIVFPERKNAEGKMMTLLMPYESDTLKPGMARIRNSSTKTLVMQFETAEGKLLRIPPNQFVDFNPSELADSPYPRIYVYESAEEGEPKLRHSSKLYFEKDKRNFFLLYPKGDHRLRILRLGGHVDPANLTEILQTESP